MKWTMRMLCAWPMIALSDIPVLAQTGGGGLAGSPTQGSALLHGITLVAVLACILVAFRFYTAVRGGRIGRGWMWVFSGLVTFACGQLLLLGGHMGLVPTEMMWVDTLRAVSVLLLFVGINQLRKIVA